MTTRRRYLAVLFGSLASLGFVGVSWGLEGDPAPEPEDVVVEETTTTTVVDEPTTTTVEDEDAEEPAPEAEDEAEEPTGEHPDNHGAAVSQAAHECPPGPGHGACVSEVARSDAGKPDKAEQKAAGTEDDDESEDESQDEDEAGSEDDAGAGQAEHGGRGGRG